MRGMILAAGRGQRMGELTANTPKPLLRVNNRFLIEYSIQSFIDAGVRDIMINVCYFGEQIKSVLGDGSRYGARFYFSDEEEALETGGGIFQVLSFFEEQPFVVLSSDVISDFPLQNLPKEPRGLAHLVLVDNPIYHPRGDFCLEQEKVFLSQPNLFTFGNIGVYRPELFAGCKPGKFRLGDLLINAVRQEKVTGEVHKGLWHNVGTPDDLAFANTVFCRVD